MGKLNSCDEALKYNNIEPRSVTSWKTLNGQQKDITQRNLRSNVKL